MKLLPLLLLASLMGCAHFSTKQTDISYEKGNTNNPTRAITTRVAAFTFLSAKSELSKFKASQTDKTQTASVGTLNQTTPESTNAYAVVTAIVEAAVKAAVTSQTGK